MNDEIVLTTQEDYESGRIENMRVSNMEMNAGVKIDRPQNSSSCTYQFVCPSCQKKMYLKVLNTSKATGDIVCPACMQEYHMELDHQSYTGIDVYKNGQKVQNLQLNTTMSMMGMMSMMQANSQPSTGSLTCPSCGKTGLGGRFCPECGTPLK